MGKTTNLKQIVIGGLLLGCCFLFSSSISAQSRRYVKLTASGAANGSSWESAFTDFQVAINSSSAGDTLFVSTGTYMPASGTSFSLKRGVKIFGGFAGTENSLSQRNWQTNVTTLKGNGSRVITNINLDNFSNFNQNYPVTYFNQFLNYVPDYSTVLNGFTISSGYINHEGGGIYNMCSSPLFENCIISSNTVSYYGKGGGMYNHVSTPKMVNCIFKNNQAVSGFPSQSGNNGAAVYSRNCHPIFIGCVFSGNSAPLGAGGAIASFSDYSGDIPGHQYFINCTFAGNSAQTGSAYWGFQPTKFKNCIFYGNTGFSGQQIYQVASYPNIFELSNCLVQGTNISSFGTGNLSASVNPLFEDEANGVYSLKPNSPCVNTGSSTVLQGGSTPDLSALAADVLNFGRKQGGTLDMGAYELTYYYQTDSTQPAQNLSFTKNTTAVNLSHLAPGGTILSYSISPALPAGLSLDVSTGLITGIPTVLSTSTKYTISIVKADGTTISSINMAVIDIPPSNLSYSTPQVFTKGVAITSLTPSVAGGPVVSYSITPTLPSGLSLNSSTGVISGTPSVLSIATNYTITATNTGGSTTSGINISVVDVPPSNLSYPTPNVFTNGTSISNLTPTISGGAVVSYSISPSLPASLTLNANTGVISGTPTILSPTTSYTIAATNTGGSTTTTVSITVNEIPPANLVYNANNTFNVCIPISSLSPTVGGGAVVSYSISPSLPGGLSINTSTGIISGTPTTPTSATNYTITATNTVGNSSATISLVVNGAPDITYATYSTPLLLTKDQPMNALVPTNSGGIVQTYSISPSLPQGLILNSSTGVISGVPTQLSSASNYTIIATSCAGTSSRVINISVIELAPSNLAYSTPNNFVKDVVIVNLVPSSMGSAVSSYSISPALPAGLNFSIATGVISGTPSVLSSATNYTITAVNNAGYCNYVISISVVSNFQLPSIDYGSPRTYYVGQPINPLYPLNSGGSVQPLLSSLSPNYTYATRLASDAAGNIYIANSNRVDLITANGTVSTIAGSASVSSPYSVAVDASGNVYIDDVADMSIKRISSNGTVDQIGNYDPIYTSGSFSFSQIEVSSGGAVYLLNYDGIIYKQTGYYNFTPLSLPVGSFTYNFKLDAYENVYFIDANSGNLYKLTPGNTVTTILSGYHSSIVVGVSGQGDVYLWDGADNSLKRVDLNGNTFEIGNLSVSTGQLTMDANNYFYILDNGQVRKYIPGMFYVSPSLPAGLRMNPQTGVISGTPTIISPTTNYLVTITNVAGSVTSGVTLTVTNATLPVTWNSFTAEKKGATSLLKWSTASEQNTKDFVVQHSTNTLSWTPLGTIFAAGNSNLVRSYNYTHKTPQKGGVYNYYRIMQRDLDGKFSYSKIASLIYDEPGPDVFVYPNPATEAVIVYLYESQDVRLINVAGAIVWKGTLAAGRNQIPLTRLAKGVYWVVTGSFKKQLLIQ